MARRIPRFSLLLSALVALVAVLIVVLGSGGGHTGRSGPLRMLPAPRSGLQRACVTARARATVSAHSAIVITARAIAPLRVSETASGPRGTVTVTRSESLTAAVRVSRPVVFAAARAASSRGCAAGRSLAAASITALEQAHAVAVARSRRQASAAAQAGLRTLASRIYPAVMALARARAGAQARKLALAAEPRLAQTARREALSRSGG